MSRNVLSKCLECELEPLGVKLADVFDDANDAIVVTDTDHRIVGWNRVAEEIYGFKQDEVMGKNVIDTIVPRCRRKKAAGMIGALNRGDSFSGEFSHWTKDGREISVHTSIRAIFDASGRKVGFLGINADISKMKRKEQQLRHQNRELQAFREVCSVLSCPMSIKETLQRAVETIVGAFSADGGCIFLLDGKSATFSPLAHRGLSELVLDELSSLKSEEGFTGHVIGSGKALLIRDTLKVKRKNWVLPSTLREGFRSFVSVPLRGKSGILGALEVTCRIPNRFDRHDLRFLEMLGLQVAGAVENAMLREELRKSLQLKTRLVREARHRLTNNLQAIASLLSTAVESNQWTGNGKAAVDSAIRRISGMGAVQQQMDLDDREAISLVEVMERIESCVREVHGSEHEMTFTAKRSSMRLSPSLASSLAIAINELVWNACAHGFDEGQTGSIAVTASVANGIVEITVKDNGRGIPEDFDLDRDANTGLSIVRNLVERDLDGKLTLRREEGTTATITWSASDARKLG